MHTIEIAPLSNLTGLIEAIELQCIWLWLRSLANNNNKNK